FADLQPGNARGDRIVESLVLAAGQRFRVVSLQMAGAALQPDDDDSGPLARLGRSCRRPQPKQVRKRQHAGARKSGAQEFAAREWSGTAAVGQRTIGTHGSTPHHQQLDQSETGVTDRMPVGLLVELPTSELRIELTNASTSSES